MPRILRSAAKIPNVILAITAGEREGPDMVLECQRGMEVCGRGCDRGRGQRLQVKASQQLETKLLCTSEVYCVSSRVIEKSTLHVRS
jgi:hypothetical protein